MACSVKLCLHFSAHALFLAVKHKQLCLARTVIPSVLLVISVGITKRRQLNISANLHQLMGSSCLICMKLLKYEEQYETHAWYSFLKKKLYGPFLLWMGFNCLKATATSRRQFTFYHSVPRNSWYSFYQPRKDERLSRPWSHPVVLIMGPLDWESSALTTRPLLLHGNMYNYLVNSPIDYT